MSAIDYHMDVQDKEEHDAIEGAIHCAKLAVSAITVRDIASMDGGGPEDRGWCHAREGFEPEGGRSGLEPKVVAVAVVL